MSKRTSGVDFSAFDGEFVRDPKCSKDCQANDRMLCETKRNQNWHEDEIKDGLVQPCDCDLCH
jgi:hypothetical protein